MKKLALLLLVPFLVFSSCKSDNDDPPPPDPANKYQVLTEYLVASDMDLPAIVSDWIVAPPAAEDVDAFIDSYDIIDIRGVEDFNGGHIEGAVNTPLADILTAAANTTKPILVVCYTGQGAGHATVALKLSGYTAKVLKWGMSGWNPDFSAKWENGIGDVAVGNANWVNVAEPTLVEFGEPTITATATDGKGLLEEMVQKMLDNGFKGVANGDVLADPSTYFINNYWAAEDYDHYGSINGAFRISPLSIDPNFMKNYDPDKTAVTYCWTGQTSSMVTAYLNVIGYNAVSLAYGTNGMIYSVLESHKFVTPTVSLPVVTE